MSPILRNKLLLSFGVGLAGILALAPLTRAQTVYTDQASFTAATSGITTVEFEGIAPNGSNVLESTGSLSISGVTFSIDRTQSNGNLFVIGQNYYYIDDSVLSSQESTSINNNLVVTLPGPTTAVGFEIADFGQAPITVGLSDGSSFLISPPGFPNLTFWGVTTATPITSLRLTVATTDIINLDNFQFGSSFQIVQPGDSAEFPLINNSDTETSPITFEAGPIAAGATVQWTAQLKYSTSGGLGAFQDLRSFTTDSTTATHNEAYESIGGKVTVQASETGSNPQSAQPTSIYVVGSEVSETDITARLVRLYGGATPNLMTGIAVRESSYLQFNTSSLYGVSALWPTESPRVGSTPSGSHIGLMQMPVSKADAWDWLRNTADGVNLFVTGKLPFAKQLTNRIIASHSGLRELTPVEMEHMALVLYGPAASTSLSKQYYVPVRNLAGEWQWVVNTAGNPQGVAYADYIFNNLKE